ncbi:hypothetical protein AZE42_11706 [Rhizopogon vesiculosus]|uniref:Uncharacterized protein n=1 Tax=Rhizopogon vesiculosus TaxID=180088 RepID=A0A1J8Q539_9AGAM|nr:hypothetical protein AZE42_11706 [Rhizopogon vesiculosus]
MTFAAALRTQYYPGESHCIFCALPPQKVYDVLKKPPKLTIPYIGLLIIRIYAAWNSKLVLTFLLVFAMLCFATACTISATHLIPIKTPLTVPNPGDCLFVTAQSYPEYCVLLLYELVMSSFSIIMTLVPPITWVAVTNSPQIVMHSVLASRILFNLRASEGCSRTHQTLEDVTDIQFQGGQRSTLISEV